MMMCARYRGVEISLRYILGPGRGREKDYFCQYHTNLIFKKKPKHSFDFSIDRSHRHFDPVALLH